MRPRGRHATAALGRLMAALKTALVGLWFLAVCALAVVMAPFRWGDRRLNRDVARSLSWGMLRLAGVRLHVDGREHLDPAVPSIVAFNHQSAFDVATFGSLAHERSVVIGKKQLAYIPFFNVLFLAAGNVMIDRKNRDSAISGLDGAVAALRRHGVSIWIAPEGTRNPDGHGLLPFKKGAFHMAIAAQVPVVPIVCAPLLPLIDWKRRIFGPGDLPMRILPPISTAGLTGDDVDALSDRVRAAMLEALEGLRATRG